MFHPQNKLFLEVCIGIASAHTNPERHVVLYCIFQCSHTALWEKWQVNSASILYKISITLKAILRLFLLLPICDIIII